MNHLHNNPLQITAELGWPGLLVWSGLMLSALWFAWQRWRRRAGLVELAGFGMLFGLMVNGLVEYNFGDLEIFMLLCVATGMANRLNAPQDRLLQDRVGE